MSLLSHINPFFNNMSGSSTPTMERFGQGYCKSGYYAGWDGKGVDSQDTCNKVCLEDPECTYAAWYGSKTCSRYNEVDCKLNGDADHVTFKKIHMGEFNIVVLCTKVSKGSSDFNYVRQVNNSTKFHFLW